MDVRGATFVQRAKVRDVEPTLRTDDQPDVRSRLWYCVRYRYGIRADHAGKNPRRAGQRLQRFTQWEDRVHIRRRSATRELRRLARDGAPAFEPVDDA
jgi:hypothetical protein